MIYYRRYLADYLIKTQRLSMIEDGAYTRLLDFYYAEEKPLPGDINEIYEIVRATKPEDKKAVKRVLDLKFKLHQGAHHNDRADAEIELSRKARANGAKNGNGTKAGTKKGTEMGTETTT